MSDFGNKPVVVGMSGGVDSAVAALLLKRQGFNVVGVFMKNWEEPDEDGLCTATQDYDDVKRVCDIIDIPYYTVNFAKEYKERVFSYFLSEYAAGRTPNPDILCNSEIKFKAFLDFAMSIGAEAIATGHYAKLDKSDGIKLMRAADANKDQTYFLAGLSASQLENVIFPLADLQKTQVREIARQAGLPVASKKDSTGICFIGERNFKNFLKQYLPARPGDIIDYSSGRSIGRHDGLMYYTIGQRKGLGIGGVRDIKGIRDTNGGSWFVIAKNLEKNQLLVQQGEHEELYSISLETDKPNWIRHIPPASGFRCTAKFRYRQPDQNVTLFPNENSCKVLFETPQRAVTPGQWAVFYKDDVCLGGAPINATELLKPIAFS